MNDFFIFFYNNERHAKDPTFYNHGKIRDKLRNLERADSVIETVVIKTEVIQVEERGFTERFLFTQQRRSFKRFPGKLETLFMISDGKIPPAPGTHQSAIKMCTVSSLFLLSGHLFSTPSKAPFIWRKVVPGKRVTLPAESTLPSVYMRKKLTPLPEPRANFPITTELAHALIVSP